jgi:hypothetical protein
MNNISGTKQITWGVLVLLLFVVGAVAFSDRLAAPTASATVHVLRDRGWFNEWEDRWETGVPGVIFIPPPYRCILPLGSRLPWQRR